MRLKLYIVVSVLFFAYTNNFGQSNQYRFSHLDISNGLSHNQVNSIFKDSEGFMWFGTSSGLNRYDGYNFKVFRHDANNKNSINFDYIRNIFEGPDKKLWISTPLGFCFYDSETERFNNDMSLLSRPLKLPVKDPQKIERTTAVDFWFLYADSGIYRYNTISKKTTRYYHRVNGVPSLYPGTIADITSDVKGNIWIVYTDGIVEMLDVKLNRITYRTGIFNKVTNNKKDRYVLLVDRDGDLWFYLPYDDSGLFYYRPSTGTFRHIDKESPGIKLKANLITNIVQADDGLIWIATDHGGVNVLDKKNATITYLLNRGDDPTSLRQNSATLYKDNLGIIWAGTNKKGISYYHKNIIKFPLFRHLDSDPASLKFNDINKFVEDKLGNLWIGTNGGGLIYFNRKTGVYTQYKNNPNNSNSLSSDIIISLCIDHDQKLWIGTYFGGLDCFDGKTFSHYKHNDKVATSIADNRVFSILEDSSHRLWIGTLFGGLEIYDREKKIFYHPLTQADISSTIIFSIFEDKHGNIWIGGGWVVDVIWKDGRRVSHYTARDGLIDNEISSINEDSRGLIWIATAGGLSVLNRKTNTIISLTQKSGLPANSVANTLEDNKGVMWLSTSNGLARVRLTPTAHAFNFHFDSFDETDGLQGREFNRSSALKTRAGELIFGGPDGFNLFDPASIESDTTKPHLIFTDFQLFNKSISANEAVNGHIILPKSISVVHAIVLNHDENIFSIEFAALDYINPGKVKYQYMLEGFNKAWVNVDNKTRKASYTNLDAGDYVFKVRVSNSEGVWNPHSISLKIKVLPPFWKSPIAYVIYVFSILGILYYIRKQGIKKIETRFEIERERKEAQHKHELDVMKIDFFTNISHEFRTPIALIMAPVEKLLKQADDNYSRRKLQLIHENSKRLLNMINQLLDFSKMAVKKLQLDLREADIIKIIKEACDLFNDLADKKHISFSFKCDTDSVFAFFDQDKIERILFNLLSNAFKFTPDFGNIAVEAKLLESNSMEMTLLEIKVTDSGVGIPAEKHNKIFERFFQNDMPASLINQGSGIGLSITKEFIDLMGGAISVESEHGKGSCFIVRLPLKLSQKNNFTGIENTPEEAEAPKPDRPSQEKRNKNITILIVEDNPDFRAYLKDDLKDLYTVAEAVNGKDGWQKVLALHPDLIISDINMAEIDGIDFCKKIRSDKRTEHIPFILITAFTGDEKQLAGLETGANDYLSKPFNFDILRFKVHNLLKNQQVVKETYQRQIEVKPGDLEIETPDTKFMKKLLTIIEENIPNTSFSVELLSSQLNMSRTTLYNKVFNLSGKTPVEFIRSVRLKRAVQLLLTKQFTIAEIAYQVGYNDAKYFSKVFKEEFLMTPSEYLDSIN